MGEFLKEKFCSKIVFFGKAIGFSFFHENLYLKP